MSELQLEVGKNYLTRGGDVIEIVGHSKMEDYPFFGRDECYYTNEGYFVKNVKDHCYNLIREVPCDYDFEMGAQYDDDAQQDSDPVNHPKHYTSHPSGIECIEITGHMGFCLGNAMKYIWRADLKHDAVEDLRKAIWYINHEISKREAS